MMPIGSLERFPVRHIDLVKQKWKCGTCKIPRLSVGRARGICFQKIREQSFVSVQACTCFYVLERSHKIRISISFYIQFGTLSSPFPLPPQLQKYLFWVKNYNLVRYHPLQ